MLKIENISKTFNPGTVNEKKALDNFSLNVNNGDFITIVGSNGAGKSTLFNSIAGTFLVDSGKITLDDMNITFLSDYKRSKYIGRLFQDPLKGTAPNMTIKENLALAYLRASGKTKPFSRISKKDEEHFRDVLATLEIGLEDRMDTPVGTLSGGQRQSLTLLMATIVPPKILLLDEHTAALDPKAAENIMKLTNRIVEENHTTCLMITHNMKMALQTGNRMLMMSDGKVIYDVSGEEKKNMKSEDLMLKFHEALNDDRILLTEE